MSPTKICDGCGATFKSQGALANHGRYSTTCTKEMRFWGKVDKSLGPNACWIWMGAITSHGYGCVQFTRGKVVGAHKVAYQLTKGEVPAGMEIMHSCDSPPCVNPAHLSIGTRQDNVNDKVAKGRQNVTPWAEHRKLTADDVRTIRSLKGVIRSGLLATAYEVEQPHIINIWNRKVWRGVE
jgi:hypothetical protein